ncbi:MAG: hypothetical protein J7M03_02600 [Candidatus Desulfofervidaceae bacterium]|nr:hypothetical protein [Candidatus Desulfofervidaceae bacterium]
MKCRCIWLSFFLFFVFFTSAASAHKITTFAYVENGIVYTETYFSGGGKAKNAKVMVYDAKTNKLLLTGTTDAKGCFHFKPPAITDLKIVVEAELGHRAVAKVEAKELTSSGEVVNPSSQTTVVPSTVKPTLTNTPQAAEDMRQIIREEMSKQLKPLFEKMVQVEQRLDRPSFTEIFGGIGYILGIFGIWAYFQKQRK